MEEIERFLGFAQDSFGNCSELFQKEPEAKYAGVLGVNGKIHFVFRASSLCKTFPWADVEDKWKRAVQEDPCSFWNVILSMIEERVKRVKYSCEQERAVKMLSDILMQSASTIPKFARSDVRSRIRNIGLSLSKRGPERFARLYLMNLSEKIFEK